MENILMFLSSWLLIGINLLYYKSTSINPSFPSESQECLGRIADIAEHKGDNLIFLVLNLVTMQVVARSELHSGLDATTLNLPTIIAPDGSRSASRKTNNSHTNSIAL
jgi:hypothetical protein